MNVFHPPLDLIIEQPCLKVWQEGDDIIYAGPLIVNSDIFEIKIKECRDGSTSRFEFSNVDNSMEQYNGILDDIKCIDAVDISSYIKSLVKIIETHNPPLKINMTICMKLISEIREFSEFYIDLKKLELAPDLSSIKVSFVDEDNRKHHVEFGVNFDAPGEIFYYKSFEVPLDIVNKTLQKKSSNLKELYNIFLEYIGSLQPFYQFMDMVDAHCTVLDPKDSSRIHTYRRVLLEKNCSVIITVEPFHMSSCPHFAFVGPNNLIGDYQRRIQKNIFKWDPKGYTFEQILLVLGIEKFPNEITETVSSQNGDEDILRADTDCSICFLYEYKENIPDITCENQCCGNVYHKECLYEWLTSIESRKNFSEIEGSCPNCDKTITCPIIDVCS